MFESIDTLRMAREMAVHAAGRPWARLRSALIDSLRIACDH